MEIIVGHTGFVGSNIVSRHSFDAAYHSKNIAQAYETKPDLCVYAGVRAEKYLAANDPDADAALLRTAIDNIERIKPRRLVLISTIDVYPDPVGVDESTVVSPEAAQPYGAHRYALEQWVRQNVSDSLIVRLPALYGANLKKNFIYDLIHVIPSALKAEKYEELAQKAPVLRNVYARRNDGFYQCVAEENQRPALKKLFEDLGFTALNFTDSRATYQFYNLAYLWEHICTALHFGWPLLNLAVEPLRASELYQAVMGRDFQNLLGARIATYDAKTKYAELFGGSDGYIFRKDRVLRDVCTFVNEKRREGRA